MSNLLLSSLSEFFISGIIFYFQHFLLFLFIISINLLKSFIGSCVLSTLSNRCFNICVVFILKSLSDDSFIWVCFFLLYITCNFLLCTSHFIKQFEIKIEIEIKNIYSNKKIRSFFLQAAKKRVLICNLFGSGLCCSFSLIQFSTGFKYLGLSLQ